MFKLSRTFILSFTTVLLGSLPLIASAGNAINTVCKGGVIDEQVLRSLYRLSDDIQMGEASLNLSPDCMETMEIKFNDKAVAVANPYVAALKMVAGKIEISDFVEKIRDPDGDLGGYTAVNRVSIDEPMVSYLRIGCGRDRECVSTVLNALDGFHPEKSPIFCDFSQRADDSVVEYFKSINFLPMPVYCMHHSLLSGNRSIPAKDDWYEAFKKLGDSNGK